jgi:predicted DNA-binding antitoxin AbrB/MazE fold protein
MKHALDAVYENGTFRPIQSEAIAIAEGQRVRITVDDEGEPQALRLAMSVYDGLSDKDIRKIEDIVLDRGLVLATDNLANFGRVTGLRIDNWLA